MAVGDLFPSESRNFTDRSTGRSLRQVTAHPSIHHPPYPYIAGYDDAMRRLIFISHRTGRPEIFAEIRSSGQLVQVTDHPTLAEWSIHPSHDGRYVYFTDAVGAWRADLETFRAECLADFRGAEIREAGMVGAAMGTTTLSHDDRWWAIPVKVGERSRFVVIDTISGKADSILERDTIGHPEFHPNDSTLLRYAGPYHDRIWAINRDGTGNRLAFRRNSAKKEWIVHEAWLPGTREITAINWPHGIIAVDVDSQTIRTISAFPAWHPAPNRRGTKLVLDTTYPDTGLWLTGAGSNQPAPQFLCRSDSSNGGTHWGTDHCPYDDGPVKVNAPQHTHPHPSFSPDDSLVLFTSDSSGYAQLYECAIGPNP